MFARALLLIAVFAGLLGAQLDARGLGSDQRTPLCQGCCAPESEASCCQSDDPPPAPATTPTANPAPDWKVAVQPILSVLPAFVAIELPRNSAPLVVPATGSLTCLDRTCIRLI